MMAKQFVNELQEGEQVDSVFVAKNKRLLEFKSKPGHYLSIMLSDRTGEVPARAWDNAEELAITFEEGDTVAVQGRAELYQGALQVIISQISQQSVSQLELGDFLAETPLDRDQLWSQLTEAIESVEDPHLRQLLSLFFDDPELAGKFRNAPAAKDMHHAYLGGLLEHTVGVISLCQRVAELWQQIDRDLLITGALLHDVGKLDELQYQQTIEYSDSGRLIGHILLGEQMVCQRMDQIEGFPEQLKLQLRHLIISHHGEPEFGAAIEPVTMEAFALHYADNLDAKLNHFQKMVGQRTDPSQVWTDYDRFLKRQLFSGFEGTQE